MRGSMQQLLLLSLLAASAAAARAQFPPLQPFEPLQPLQPMQPFRPLAPLPPMRPMPGFPAFPEMPQMPPFPGFGQQPFAGAGAGAAGGRAGPGSYTASSSSSSFGGPRASSTPGCTVVQETSGESQGSSSAAGSASCSLSQRIEICQGGSSSSGSKPGTPASGHTRAGATINGQPATCCVVLLKLPAKTPQLFCAGPGGKAGAGYARMPAANTAVELKPECSSGAVGAKQRSVGSLSCTVTFTQLPEGYTYPEGYTAASPMVLYRGGTGSVRAAGSTAGSAATGTTSTSIGGAAGVGASARGGFAPCNNRRFRKFMQAVSRPLPDGGVVLTSKCD